MSDKIDDSRDGELRNELAAWQAASIESFFTFESTLDPNAAVAFSRITQEAIEAFLDQLTTAQQVAALVSLKQRLADSQAILRVQIRTGG